ncbi:MAG: hypothetical protein ABIO86_14695 [Sphingomonas sp.]
MYTDGATQNSLELWILACLSNGYPKNCQEVIRYVRHEAALPPEALKPRQKRNGEPQFHLIVRNSLEEGRRGNLEDKGFVHCLGHDKYEITPAGLERLQEIQRHRDMLSELESGF